MYLLKPSVKRLSEQEIRAALNGGDEESLIVLEFGRMLKELIDECRRVSEAGEALTDLLGTVPSSAMEKIAIEMLAEVTGEGQAPDRLFQFATKKGGNDSNLKR